MMDELLLLSGNDIPFPFGQVTIHQPRLREIAYITEEKFWPGCQLLKFNKEILPDQDKVNLLNRSNFNIIMTMIKEKNSEAQKARINVFSILALLFPDKQILLGRNIIQLRNPQNVNEVNEINEDNFESFKEILIDMFCLKGDNKQYDPSGELAKKIANQIKRGREKKAKLAPEKKVSILSRYVSILAVGQKKDINDLMNYTVYQIMDEFKRFNLKMRYDAWYQAKVAGCTGMNDPEDWFKDIYDNSNDNNNDYIK